MRDVIWGRDKKRLFFVGGEGCLLSAVRLLWPPPVVTLYLNNIAAHWSPGRGHVGSDLDGTGMLECLWLRSSGLFLARPLTSATVKKRRPRLCAEGREGGEVDESKVGSDHLLSLWSADLTSQSHTRRQTLCPRCAPASDSGHKRRHALRSRVNTQAKGWLHMSTHTKLFQWGRKHTNTHKYTRSLQMQSTWVSPGAFRDKSIMKTSMTPRVCVCVCVAHAANIYSLHLVAIHNIITPSACVNVKPGRLSRPVRVCIFFLHSLFPCDWLTREAGTLEKPASLHHLACANLSLLAWPRTARRRDVKGNWKHFLKIIAER